MSQEQPRRPENEEQQRGKQLADQGTPGSQGIQVEPIKYGDVFNVSGDLASRPIQPQDAALMQTAETTAFGQPQGGGPAELMRSAAVINEQAGLVGTGDLTDIAKDQGVTITGTNVPGGRIITESFAGQVVGQHVQVAAPQQKYTIGQALEATVRTAGDKPVDESDAAAITSAQMRGTGSDTVTQTGFAASAQSAAAYNSGIKHDADKIKLKDILAGASATMPKEVTREDADAVVIAEVRNRPNVNMHPGGVASSMDTAARLNEGANFL